MVGFSTGSSDLYRAKYFMDEDVVLVTVTYRVGVLGKSGAENAADE